MGDVDAGLVAGVCVSAPSRSASMQPERWRWHRATRRHLAAFRRRVAGNGSRRAGRSG